MVEESREKFKENPKTPEISEEIKKMSPEEIEKIDEQQENALKEIKEEEISKDEEFAGEVKLEIDEELGKGKTEEVLEGKIGEKTEESSTDDEEIKEERSEEEKEEKQNKEEIKGEIKIDEGMLKTELGNLYDEAINNPENFKQLLESKSMIATVNGKEGFVSLTEIMTKKFEIDRETVKNKLEGVFNSVREEDLDRSEFETRATTYESIMKGSLETAEEKRNKKI